MSLWIHPLVSRWMFTGVQFSKTAMHTHCKLSAGHAPREFWAAPSRRCWGTQELSSPEETTCDTSDFLMFKWEQHEKRYQRREIKNKFLNLPRSRTDVDGGV